MASPFYKVYIEKNNRDISEIIEKFTYEDCTEEDSYLEIVVAAAESLKYADDPDLIEGTWLCFQFGYLQEQVSKLHRIRITDIKTRYADRVTLTIKCLDIGTAIRKDTDKKVWKGKTSTQIAKEIASKWGLSFEGDATSKVWDSVPQGNKTDMSFLKYLADREDTGNYTVYIRNTTLYFNKRKTDQKSSKTFTYNDPNGSVVTFEPEWKESSQDTSAIEGKVDKIDFKTNAVVSTKVNSKNEAKTGTLGESKVAFTGMFGYKRTIPATGKQITTPTKNAAEATNLANSKKKKNTLKQLVANLLIEGDPNITPNTVITMSGVAKNHGGNWFVIKVTHDITSSGYQTRIGLNKNGTNKKSAEKAKDANKTVGPKKAEDKVKLLHFDGMFRRKK